MKSVIYTKELFDMSEGIGIAAYSKDLNPSELKEIEKNSGTIDQTPVPENMKFYRCYRLDSGKYAISELSIKGKDSAGRPRSFTHTFILDEEEFSNIDYNPFAITKYFDYDQLNLEQRMDNDHSLKDIKIDKKNLYEITESELNKEDSYLVKSILYASNEGERCNVIVKEKMWNIKRGIFSCL